MLAWERVFLCAFVYGDNRGTNVTAGGICMHDLSKILCKNMESLLDILPTCTIIGM